MKRSENLQKLISYGYLFLIAIGILKESVFYYQLGINILNYSTITDILISPIADIVSHPILLGAVLLLLFFSYTIPILLSKKRNKNWAKHFSGLKNKQHLTEEQVKEHFAGMSIMFVAVTLLSFFLGIGWGEGAKLNQKLANNKLQYTKKINFSNGDTENIYLIGANSMYYFYIGQENKNIRISPTSTIRSMELLNNKLPSNEK